MQHCHRNNQTSPNTICLFLQEIVEGLESIGHVTEQFGVGGSVVCAIARQNGKLYANSDFRKSGEVDGL